MIKIIPSILTSDIQTAKDLIAQCEGVVDQVSIDVIDGKFANNKTIFPDALSEIESSIAFDYQLMVEEPINWVEKCVRGGADRIIGHIEKMSDQMDFVEKVQSAGRKVGLAVDLKTSIGQLDKQAINNSDVVLLMSVPAGFGGQKFHKEVFGKIEFLNKIRSKDTAPFKIQIDGGVLVDYMKELQIKKVDEVSVGMRIFKGDLAFNIEKFKKAVD